MKNSQKVILEITGTQNIDRQFDKTQLDTVGVMHEYDDKYIFEYTEQLEPPENPVDVTVCVTKDERSVEMTRNGDFPSQLVIERSQRNLCHYGTQFGDILMGISGHLIEHKERENGGTFSFSYDIDINGALASKNKVRLNYKKIIQE